MSGHMQYAPTDMVEKTQSLSVSSAMNHHNLNRLVPLAKLFGKLGVIGFGGPAAHIAMMEDEVVKRRQWLTLLYIWYQARSLGSDFRCGLAAGEKGG